MSAGVRIVWDEPKRIRNLADHGLDFSSVEPGFFQTALVLPTYPGRRGEAHYRAVGIVDGDLVTLIFAPLGSEALSLISLRRASRKERRIYAEA